MQISRIKKIILICVFYFYKHVRIIIVNVTNADVTVYENEKKYENIYVYMYCALTKVAWGNSSLKMGEHEYTIYTRRSKRCNASHHCKNASPLPACCCCSSFSSSFTSFFFSCHFCEIAKRKNERFNSIV